MAKIIAGHQLSTALCDVLGLDRMTTARIALVADARGPARVTVESYVTDEQAEALRRVLRAYQLIEEPKQDA